MAGCRSSCPRDMEELWLDPSINDPGALGNVLVPNTEDAMEACEV